MASVDGLADSGVFLSGAITQVPRELSVVERYRLIRIAHETTDREIRELALSLLRPPPSCKLT